MSGNISILFCLLEIPALAETTELIDSFVEEQQKYLHLPTLTL